MMLSLGFPLCFSLGDWCCGRKSGAQGAGDTRRPGPAIADRIDHGESAGKVTSDDLAKGWNLANAPGPITKQSREVLRLVFEKNNVFFRRWREIQLFNFPGWAQGSEVEAKRSAELARLDQQIAELETQIDQARKPKSRRFELKLAAQ